MKVKEEFIEAYDRFMDAWESAKDDQYTLKIIKLIPFTENELRQTQNLSKKEKDKDGYLVYYENGVSEWRDAEIIRALLGNVN